MACDTCATKTENGLPSGCKNNGHCATGSCNKFSTFDWLSDISFNSIDIFPIHELSFQSGSRKAFFRNESKLPLSTGDLVVVEATQGYDIGQITLSGELVRLQLKKKGVPETSPDIKKILRIPTTRDMEIWETAKNLEMETMVRARVIARSLNLEMKIGEVEYQGDKTKATFFYTADGRVDFRELIRSFAREFRVKIEMRQIGARQEAGKIGGLGSCGRELCCSTWLIDFSSVTTSAARYQNLSINQTKLSGQCGRLKCCLNYELDTYLDALQDFPDKAEKLETERGIAFLQKTDIFKKQMWYGYPGSSTQIPLEIDEVQQILNQNSKGKKAKDLLAVAEEKQEKVQQKVEYEDLVGQVSLKQLENKTKKKKHKKKKPRSSSENNRRS